VIGSGEIILSSRYEAGVELPLQEQANFGLAHIISKVVQSQEKQMIYARTFLMFFSQSVVREIKTVVKSAL
jgi:hypothetical protein